MAASRRSGGPGRGGRCARIRSPRSRRCRRRERRFTSVLPPDAASLVPEHARAALIADADRLLKGEWEMLGVVRTDMAQPDWFY